MSSKGCQLSNAGLPDYVKGDALLCDLFRRRRLWASKGASAPVYALLACTALMQPYRKFVWLFGIELNSLGCELFDQRPMY